jgi:hypothetical protein
MFFKLKGNHQGVIPSLYRKYGQELLMWAGVIWKRKIVFGKFRHKAAPKNDDIVYLLIGKWNVLKTRRLGYNSHTEAPTVKYVIRSDSLESAVSFGIYVSIFFMQNRENR